jgi:serine/threonine kinase PknH
MTIFVSYARKDWPTVESLVRDIEDLAGSVWFDREIPGGQLWWEAVLKEVRGCRLFVFALSGGALRSEACLSELNYALALGRPMLAVQIGVVDLAGAPEELRRTQIINFVERSIESVKILAKAIYSAPPPPSLPADLPAEPPVPKSYRDRYGAVFSNALSMDDQEQLLALLRYDLDHGVETEEATSILRTLRDRRDVVWAVREEIDTIMRTTPATMPTRETPAVAPETAPATPVPTVQEIPEAGWYADPAGRFELRYWDGKTWSEHVSREDQQFKDPPVA